jgi:hypothetical protein
VVGRPQVDTGWSGISPSAKYVIAHHGPPGRWQFLPSDTAGPSTCTDKMPNGQITTVPYRAPYRNAYRPADPRTPAPNGSTAMVGLE